MFKKSCFKAVGFRILQITANNEWRIYACHLSPSPQYLETLTKFLILIFAAIRLIGISKLNQPLTQLTPRKIGIRASTSKMKFLKVKI